MVLSQCVLQMFVTQASHALGSKSLLQMYALALTGRWRGVSPRQRHLEADSPLKVEAAVPYDVFAKLDVSRSQPSHAVNFPSSVPQHGHAACSNTFTFPFQRLLRFIRKAVLLVTVLTALICGFYYLSPKEKARDSTLGYPGEGPVRILAKLGELTLHIMVDSGSDYNAINADLAVLQERANNPAFGGRRNVQPESIGGYAEGLNKVVTQASKWTVTLTGFQDDDTMCTKPVVHSVAEEFHEVLGLNDPLILGNPWLDKHGPLVIDRDVVFLNNLWMDRTDRTIPKELASNELRACCMCSQTGPLVDDRGWYPVEVLVDDFAGLRHALDRRSVWVEGSHLYDHLCVLESRLCKERGDTGPLHPDAVDHAPTPGKGTITVLVTASPGQVFRLLPSKPVAILRWEESDDTEILESFSAAAHGTSQMPPAGQISAAKYKMRQKTDAQAKLFPQLLDEIEDRRRHLEQLQPKDIHGEAYKAGPRNLQGSFLSANRPSFQRLFLD